MLNINAFVKLCLYDCSVVSIKPVVRDAFFVVLIRLLDYFNSDQLSSIDSA